MLEELLSAYIQYTFHFEPISTPQSLTCQLKQLLYFSHSHFGAAQHRLWEMDSGFGDEIRLGKPEIWDPQSSSYKLNLLIITQQQNAAESLKIR